MAVDDDNFALREKVHDAKQISADTTKTVDAYPDHNKNSLGMRHRADFGVFPQWAAPS